MLTKEEKKWYLFDVDTGMDFVVTMAIAELGHNLDGGETCVFGKSVGDNLGGGGG